MTPPWTLADYFERVRVEAEQAAEAKRRAEFAWREQVESWVVYVDEGDRMLVRWQLRDGGSRLEWVRLVRPP
jgi:hypothetical protein